MEVTVVANIFSCFHNVVGMPYVYQNPGSFSARLSSFIEPLSFFWALG